jgi:type IV secretion system protein TrbL
MSFWKTFGKWAIPAAAIAATIATGGAASPLIGMAIGAGAGAGEGALSGGGWKGVGKGALIGGATGAIGGGALKGMGTAGKVITQANKYKGYVQPGLQATKALTAGMRAPTGAPQSAGLSGPPSLDLQQGQGFLNPLGMTNDRRTNLAGMGTRQYA